MSAIGAVTGRATELSGVLADTVAEADTAGRPSQRALQALRESGLCGVSVPREYGGAGGDGQDINRCVTDVARVDPSTAIILFQHLAVAARIVEWGSGEQRRRYLPRLATGEVLAASAWSEVGAGANKRHITTTATRRPGGWIIDGAKAFTTGAGVADLYLTLAATGAEADDADTVYGGPGQSFFLVDAGTDGVLCDSWPRLAGMRNSATGSVEFRGCHVPADAMLGPDGGAPRIIAGVRETGASLGAVSVGIAEAALDLARQHAVRHGQLSERTVRRRLVKLRTRMEAAHAIVERAGRRDGPSPGDTTLFSKLYASVAAEEICGAVARLLGSGGFLADNPINRLARDARAVALMGPTNELCGELVSIEWRH